MRRVLEHLQRAKAAFEDAPLFGYLRDASIAPDERLAFAPAVAHFVMSFADLYSLVLRQEPPTDRFQTLVNAHAREDGDHWRWYLADLVKMGHDPTMRFTDALRLLFSKETARTRMLTYRICRLVADADSVRKLVLVHCIEATGSVTVNHVSAVGRELAARLDTSLVYFGPHHFTTEAGHTLEDDSVHHEIEDITLSDAKVEELKAVVDESFAAFRDFVDEMAELSRRAPQLRTLDD